MGYKTNHFSLKHKLKPQRESFLKRLNSLFFSDSSRETFIVMMGRKSNPMIGVLAGNWVSGSKSCIVNVGTSSTDHHEPKNTSPRGPKNFNLGGVGLAIVAALEKSGETPANKAMCSRNSRRSNPIPVNSPKNSSQRRELENNSEEYTIVTFHGPHESSHTRVYGLDHGQARDFKTLFQIQRRIQSKRASVFHISPARFGPAAGIPANDFLSSCDMCKKLLDGKDIYMYRGEKAFCSTECRDRQIVDDECQEKCVSEAAWPPVDVLISSLTNEKFLTPGILAI